MQNMSRRALLQWTAAGVLGTSFSGWFGLLANRAAEASKTGVKHKSAILLWMAGGPAQSHTFDVKPGGDYKPIKTAVPGIEISEHLPKVAEQMKEMALIRSMSTKDGNHSTATYLMHTGFRKGSGGVAHPSMGAIAAHELGQPDFELPNFVSLGNAPSSGHLGPKFSPLVLNDYEKGLPDLRPTGGTTQSDVDDRASLVEELDRAFTEDYGLTSAKAHQTTVQRAINLMHSDKTKAFDLDNEPAKVRDAYGRSKFGQGCLLARRLVEIGVPFVEVALGGWDTHQNATQRVKTLSEQVDPGMATLLSELKDRGLLDTTLVIWMGEFGRSPGNGSSHYSRAWTSVLAGAGLKTGQVIGGTGAKGADVEKGRPVTSPDFMATVCRALGIDYTKNWTVRGRPIQKVDRTAKPVEELFA